MLRRVLIVLGTLIVALMVIAGAFNLLALAARHTFSVTTRYAGIRSLEVDSGNGDVQLTGAPAGSPVVVVAHVAEDFIAPRPQVRQPRPGVLQLTYSCGTTTLSARCSVSYDVSVPAGVPVTVNAGDGDVTATGLDSPQISLESGNGDVSATLSRPADRLTASSGNGDVTLTVPNVSYAVRATSGNGNVSDQSLSIDPHSLRRIDAESGNGDVTVTAR